MLDHLRRRAALATVGALALASTTLAAADPAEAAGRAPHLEIRAIDGHGKTPASIRFTATRLTRGQVVEIGRVYRCSGRWTQDFEPVTSRTVARQSRLTLRTEVEPKETSASGCAIFYRGRVSEPADTYPYPQYYSRRVRAEK